MDEPRTHRFLVVESDAKYAQWLQHAVSAGWPANAIVIMDWTSFGRVRTAMTVRDYDVVMLSLAFDEGIEEPTTKPVKNLSQDHPSWLVGRRKKKPAQWQREEGCNEERLASDHVGPP